MSQNKLELLCAQHKPKCPSQNKIKMSNCYKLLVPVINHSYKDLDTIFKFCINHRIWLDVNKQSIVQCLGSGKNKNYQSAINVLNLALYYAFKMPCLKVNHNKNNTPKILKKLKNLTKHEFKKKSSSTVAKFCSLDPLKDTIALGSLEYTIGMLTFYGIPFVCTKKKNSANAIKITIPGIHKQIIQNRISNAACLHSPINDLFANGNKGIHRIDFYRGIAIDTMKKKYFEQLLNCYQTCKKEYRSYLLKLTSGYIKQHSQSIIPESLQSMIFQFLHKSNLKSENSTDIKKPKTRLQQ